LTFYQVSALLLCFTAYLSVQFNLSSGFLFDLLIFLTLIRLAILFNEKKKAITRNERDDIAF